MSDSCPQAIGEDMGLKRLYVDNYRCLVNFEIEFDEITLLLGVNGSGKSSILDVMAGLHRLLSGTAKVDEADAFPIETLTRWQNVNLQVFELDLTVKDGVELRYRLEVEHDRQRRRSRIVLEKLTEHDKPLFEFVKGEVRLYHDDHQLGPVFGSDWTESALARVAPRHDNRKLSSFLRHARKFLVCRLVPQSFDSECRTEDPLLLPDGSNFAAWYRYLFQERQELVPDYMNHLSKIIDGFKSLRLASVGENARIVKVVYQRQSSRFELSLDELSDGERALLAVYALLLMTSEDEYTLFLDEPDNFIALTELQPLLMHLKDRSGEGLPQVVICSHHPELIDYLGYDCGLILEREKTGVTVMKRPVPSDTEPALKLSELIARGWE